MFIYLPRTRQLYLKLSYSVGGFPTLVFLCGRFLRKFSVHSPHGPAVRLSELKRVSRKACVQM